MTTITRTAGSLFSPARSTLLLPLLLAAGLGAFSFSSSADSTQAIFYWLGHIAFMLAFYSFWQRSLFKLRVLAVASLLFGLVYNTYVHLHMPTGQSLWPVLMWMGIFLAVNVYRSLADLSYAVERNISAAQRPVQAAAFPEIHSADWLALMEVATSSTYEKGATVIEIGASTPSLMILSVGGAEEQNVGGEPVPRAIGTMWGELTWAMGPECYNESPCRVVVTSQHATVIELPYVALTKLTCENPRLRMAILDGIVRDQARKNSRLRLDFDVLTKDDSKADFSLITFIPA